MTHLHMILSLFSELLIIKKKKYAASINVSAHFDFSKVLTTFEN